MYSNHLNTINVRYWNAQSMPGLQMVQYLNCKQIANQVLITLQPVDNAVDTFSLSLNTKPRLISQPVSEIGLYSRLNNHIE